MVAAILFFLLLFTPLIFLHELGHYVAARLCRVRVEAFSVGFGRVLWKTQRWGTEWRLSAVPFGGYVKMAGENHHDDRTPEPDELWAKSPWQRAFIAFAGPAVNLALPVLVFTWFLMSGHNVIAPIIGGINAGSAAANAGIQTGDRILRIDDQKITGWSDLAGLIGPAAGRSLSMVVERNGQPVTLTVTPDTKTVEDPLGGLTQRGMLGISSAAQAPFIAPRPGDDQLQAFDRVTQVDGKPIRTLHELKLALTDADAAELTIERDPQRQPGKRFVQAKAQEQRISWTRPQGVTGFPFEPVELLVEGVKDNSPAQEAGLAAGDRIRAVDGVSIATWGELEQHLLSAPEQRGDVRVERMSGDGVVELLTMTLSLREAEVDGPLRSSRKVMDHGILRTYWHAAPKVETIELGLVGATVLATQRCAQIIGTMVEGLRRILVGRVSVKQIGGPVMLYDIAAEVSKTKDTFWHWFSLLSLNLGIMNLLPVPVLDGGLILLSGIEILRRRPLTVALREKANYIGLFLVLALMLTAVVNDVMRVFG
ncbi:MAG: RIP metalloprotease RseP [Myxococcota bacterium]|nr:RIP metalloprotease RseP [Myxococcota bacterium]